MKMQSPSISNEYAKPREGYSAIAVRGYCEKPSAMYSADGDVWTCRAGFGLMHKRPRMRMAVNTPARDSGDAACGPLIFPGILGTLVYCVIFRTSLRDITQ